VTALHQCPRHAHQPQLHATIPQLVDDAQYLHEESINPDIPPSSRKSPTQSSMGTLPMTHFRSYWTPEQSLRLTGLVPIFAKEPLRRTGSMPRLLDPEIHT
jgi:hypothetical protein